MKPLDEETKLKLVHQAVEEKASADRRVVIDLQKLSQSDMWAQLDYLKEFTKRTCMLHEAQVRQLKVWPRVLFQRSTKSTVGVTFPDKGNPGSDQVPRLVFDIIETSKPVKLSKDAAIFDRKSAPGALDAYVKRMLGQEWDVTIRVTRGTKKREYHFGPQFGRPEGLVVRVEGRNSKGRSGNNPRHPQ